MGKVFLFVSGKGGAGKTTVCVNLAVKLAETKKRVLVIDADIWLRNADILLGLQNDAVLDVGDVFAGDCTFEKAVIGHPTVGNIDFLAAPARLRVPAERMFGFISDLADRQAAFYDFVLVDCPAGTSVCESALAARKHAAIVVSTSDLTSLRDAERTAGLLKKHGCRDVRLIINKVDAALIRTRLAPNIDEIIDSISVRLIGVVPEDKLIPAYTYVGKFACSSGSPKVRQAFANIACRLTGGGVPLIKLG